MVSSGHSPGNLKLQADTETVEDLVTLVRRGVVRIPRFQRGLKWNAEDVVALFDSIYRGYPVGSMLLRKGKAAGELVKIGPLTIDGPETNEALWVVDGQQRLTALTVGLSRPRPIPRTPDDPWVIYFDAGEQAFRVPPKAGEVPSTWVPVAELLDAAALSEWVFNWKHGADSGLRSSLFQAGARLRQYEVPVCTLETDDERLLREIFYRINKSGRALDWDEVHDALFGDQGGHPSTLGELREELGKLGMGMPEEEQLLSCITAFKGLDVTLSVGEHLRRNREVFASVVQDALPAIRGVLSFFKRHAEIPHLRLLPRSIPLFVLTRFFALYPDPKPRSVELLVRWTWRLLLSSSSYDEHMILRHGVMAIGEADEEKSVQELLSLLPKKRRIEFALPTRFDARAADSRIALLGLSSLGPRDVQSGARIDVAALIEAHDVAAFRRILPTEDELGPTPANRILLPGSGAASEDLLRHARAASAADEVLQSHAISSPGVIALEKGDAAGFLRYRKAEIESAVHQMGERLAAWSKTDRPSISYLLQQAEAVE